MTKQDILDYFKDINAMYNECTRYDDLSRMIDELQEPCTDAISRQAVLDLAKFDGRENLGSIIHAFDVEQLPPVTLMEKREPCVDAISREAVIDIIEDVCPIYGNDYRYILRDKVNELPPVKPAEKEGQWEWNQYDGNPKIGNWHCSQCHGIGKSYYDYCPYCGAKMASPTGAESEGGTQHERP